MDKKRFGRLSAKGVLILWRAALWVVLAAKAVIQFLWLVLGPPIRRGDVFSKVFKGLALIGMAGIFFMGLNIYNELIDFEHFLQVAHGRLLVEMQRQQVVRAGCGNAVARYAAMEEKIQERLIALHGLTQTHGPRAPIVESEGLELIKLVKELDLLIEKYPDLKSKGPYVFLMETIQETGLQVITARLNYNNWTYNYNVRCRLFPHNIIARGLGFREQPFLQGPLNYSLLKEN